MSAISQWIDNNPTIALGGALIGVLLGGAFLLNKKTISASASTTSPSASTQDLSGLTSNGTTQPIVYVPTQTTFSTTNATDASQNVTNSGTGTVNTGSSAAGNSPSSGSSTGPSSPVSNPVTTNPVVVPTPIAKNPPVPAPPKISMSWSQRVTSSNQSLNLLASNASNAMSNDPLNTSKQKFTVTGQQVYNYNKTAVDAFFHSKYPKGYTAGQELTVGTSGLTVTLPHIIKG
jgi:hypothetical protein